VLAPALIVGASAVAATAHGGYEVAVASGVPEGLIGSLYPVITDGLALVAYAATHRLLGAARGYAWSVVVASAALSGLAQAVYLVTGPGLIAPAAIRFGVGAWPAVAGAVAAHLVYLLAARPADQAEQVADTDAPQDEPAALVEQSTTLPPVEPVVDDPPVAEPPARPALRIAPAALATPTVRVPVVEDAVAKARRLLAADTGRPTLARELGIKDHQARALLAANPDEVPALLARYEAARA
jgi:hypothetical protein